MKPLLLGLILTCLLAEMAQAQFPFYHRGKATVLEQEVKVLKDSLDRLQARLLEFRGPNFSEWSAPDLAFSLERYNNTFDIYIVDIRERDLALFLNNQKRPIRNLGKLKQVVEAQGNKLLFAMNGGMYRPDRSPQGLYVEDGRQLTPLDTVQEAYGNFYLQPNGVFFIDSLGRAGISTTIQFDTLRPAVRFATQSGPMLVIDGQLHPVFRKGSSNLHIRNGVGVIDAHRLVFAISRRPVNLYDFASLFRDYFGCENALYLDGAISRLYLPTLGRDDLGGDFGPIIGVTANFR